MNCDLQRSRRRRGAAWALVWGVWAAAGIFPSLAGSIGVGTEYRYPVAFETRPQASRGPNGEYITTPVVVPTEFETRRTGTLVVEPRIVVTPIEVVEKVVSAPPPPAKPPEAADLHQAAAAGDTARIRALLDAGLAVDARDNRGYTALMAAALYGRTEAARLLLERGADADRGSAQGLTPLMCAAHTGRPDVIRLLLASPLALNRADARGWTALMHAVDGGRTDVVRLLLERGAAPNLADRQGQTPLALARAKGPSAMEALLAAPPKPAR